MQPRRTEHAIARQQFARLLGVARFGIEVALIETNAPSVAQIDGRNQQHQLNLRKFSSRRAPAAPERSGWNCVPQKLARRTTAGMMPPYSAVASVASVSV